MVCITSTHLKRGSAQGGQIKVGSRVTTVLNRMFGGRTMTRTRLSIATTCAILVGSAALAPSTAEAQCHTPVYSTTTYVDYVAPVAPVRTVYVNRPVYSRPVYVPPPVYVERPVYVAPYRSRSFNLNVSFGNRGYRSGHGHHRNFRHHDGRSYRRGYNKGRRSRGFRHDGRRYRGGRRYRR